MSPGPAAPTPPAARRVAQRSIVHGEPLVDDYVWLRDKKDPGGAGVPRGRERLRRRVMAPTRAAAGGALRRDARPHPGDRPERALPEGRLFYYSRTEQGKQYPIHCRKQGSLDGARAGDPRPERARRGQSLHGARRLHGERRRRDCLAYSTDDTGYPPVHAAREGPRTRAASWSGSPSGSAAWPGPPTIGRSSTPSRTSAEAPVPALSATRSGRSADALVYEEPDEAFDVVVYRTRSGAYLLLGCGSLTTTEARFLPAATPDGEWRLVAPRIHDQEYDVDHHGDRFYIRANDTGRNFRLVTAPVASPGRDELEARSSRTGQT